MRPEASSRRVFSARSLTLMIATAGIMITMLAGAPAHAQADPSGTQDWLNRINGLRTSHGLNALILDANLSDLAQQRAETNARTGTLVHTPNLAVGVTANWSKLAENIGAGQDHDGLWNAFLNSPSHLANLLDPAFTHVGIGEVSSGPGNDWVTHRFMRLAPSAAPAPAAGSAPAAATSTPIYVVPASPTPRASSTTHRSGSTTANPAASGSHGATNLVTTAPASTDVGDGADSDASASGPPGDGPRSPDHVAAVVNVLQALEN